MLIEKHQREMKFQEADKNNDLPQVEIRTTKGTIVLELFEDQAPETVGNFINLLESGFYSETYFHRVIRQFMAQGGGFTATSSGKPVTVKSRLHFWETLLPQLCAPMCHYVFHRYETQS